MSISNCIKSFWRGVGKSLVVAGILLFWDAAYTGSFLLSLLVCPVWILVSLVRSAIRRPGWTLALIRVVIPALTLWFVLHNDTIQREVASQNAEKVIAACEEFHAVKGRYPKTLDELVPRYMPSVPRAKYCLSFFGKFLYWGFEEGPILTWYVVPPYGRRLYDFEDKRWCYLD